MIVRPPFTSSALPPSFEVEPSTWSRNPALSVAGSMRSLKATRMVGSMRTPVARSAGATPVTNGGVVSMFETMSIPCATVPAPTVTPAIRSGSSLAVSGSLRHSAAKLVWAPAATRSLTNSGVSGKPPTSPSSGVRRTP